MSRVHDLGGVHGFGPIRSEADEEEAVFHAPWEARVHAMVFACGALGRWSIDESRHSRERLDPVSYLGSSYYEKWLMGLRTLLVEKGILTGGELSGGRPSGPAPPELSERRLSPHEVTAVVAKGRPATMESTTEPLFQPGDVVRVRPVTTAGHTRAVRYAAGRYGTIETYHGCHVYPDLSAHGEKVGRHLYGVVFTSRELWGETGSPDDTVHIDLWEPYLEASS